MFTRLFLEVEIPYYTNFWSPSAEFRVKATQFNNTWTVRDNKKCQETTYKVAVGKLNGDVISVICLLISRTALINTIIRLYKKYQ